ncbi:CDP-diacylglycerol---serine O-phosphatidyltransferase [Cohaesibacter sp. ES.047]|uniref:CDP-alcohol phosphatidyltransferase family protein n=1 Tax=Cohaesibacter sp. ES.047 TaxID=1798205 RepID=UPI000BBFDDC2|nr:phosphatidylcholine/phosphatidylserine synthase [Cohaesibacter sp. ES.047]SNY93048.1 CDP-diacylglycerol---serine O-phosphatidyltransferase [Cohaesibacter sp. ES.047]
MKKEENHDHGLGIPFQSFEPEEPASPRRFRAVPFRSIAPNLVTLLALSAGLTGVRMAIEGRFELALVSILAAAFLDGIDGRLARMLNGASRFGAELDSLTDFVNFGVAPAIILHVWILHAIPSIGWIASLLFAIAMVLRLARFNVALDEKNRPSWRKAYFVGVPAPAGAFAVLAPIYVELAGVPHYDAFAAVVMLYTLFIAMLVVSSIPTFSGKTIGLRIPRAQVLPLMVGLVAAVALLFSYPWLVLSGFVLLYLLSIPFARRSWYRANERMLSGEWTEADGKDEIGTDDEDDPAA